MGHNLQQPSSNPYGYYDANVQPGVQPGDSPNAYVQPNNATAGTGRGSMDFLNKLGKQAEDMAGNIWGHLKVGSSVPDTALGRLSHGTRLLREGGFEGVYKQTFGASPNELLQKTYACYLSTSNGAIGGTLYITNQKFAFCSDRPISYTPTPGQQASSYYKVIVPLEKVREVAPAANTKKPTEKYIQVLTVDGHEFWFMGFVNYDKGLKNMQAAVQGGTQNHATPGATSNLNPNAFQPPYPPAQNPGQHAYPSNPGSGPNVYPPNQTPGQGQGWSAPYPPSR